MNNVNESDQSIQSHEGEVISLSGHMPPISSPDVENTFETFQPIDFSPDQQNHAHFKFNQHEQAKTLDFRKNLEPVSLEETDIIFKNIQICQISNIKANDDQELLKAQNIFKQSESQLIQVSARTGTQLVQPDQKIEKIEDQIMESSKTSRAEINCAVTKEIIQENQNDFKSIKSQKFNHQRNKSESLIDINSKSYSNNNQFNDFSNMDVQKSNNPYQDIKNQNLNFYLKLQEKLKHKRLVSSSISREQNLQEYLSMSKKSPLNPISFRNINLQKSIDKCNIFDYVKYLEGNNSSILNKNQQVENSSNKACPFILQEMKESDSQTANPSYSKCEFKIDKNEAIFNVKEFEQEDDQDNEQEIENGEVRRLSTSSSGNIVSSEKKRFAIQDINSQEQQPFHGLKLQEFTIKLMNYNDGNMNACEDDEGSENLVHDTQENCQQDKSEAYNDTILNTNSNNNPIIKQIPFNIYRPCLNTQFQGNGFKQQEERNAYIDLLNKNQSYIASQTEVERFSSNKQNSQAKNIDQNLVLIQKNSLLEYQNYQNNLHNEMQIVNLDVQGQELYKNKSPQNQIINLVPIDNNQLYKTVTQDKLQNYFKLDFNKIKRFNELNQNKNINNNEQLKIKQNQDLIAKEYQIIDCSKYHTFQGEGRSQNNIQQLKSLIENVHIDSLLQDCEKQDQYQNYQHQNLYYRTQPYNKKEQQNKIQFNSLIETKDLTKNRLTKSVCLQKYNNLIIGAGDNKTENNFGKGYQRLISPVKNNANLSINFGQSMKLLNMNRGIPLGQDELVPFNNTDQKTQLNLMLDHQTNSIENLLHQNQIHGIGTCFKIDDSNKSSSNITSKNQLTQAINEQKMEHIQMNLNKITSSYINTIPSPINGSENINIDSQINTQKHQNLPSNGTFLRTGIVDLNKSYSLNNFNQEDDCQSRNQTYSCYKSKDEQKFNYQNYLSLLNLTKNQQINTYNFVERAYRIDKIELQKQNALLQQRVDQQKQEIDELQQKGEKSKLQYEKIIQILRKNKKNKKRCQSKNSDHQSLILEENNNLQIESESSSDSKSISNLSQISLKLLEMQHKEVEKIRELYENDKKQKVDNNNIEKIQIQNEQIENIKNNYKRDLQIQELKHRQEITEKNQQIMNIQQQFQIQKIEYEKLIKSQNLASPSDNGERNDTVNNFSNPTFKNNRINSIKQENEYIFQLEQQIQDLRNEIKKQVVDSQNQNIFNNQNNYQSNKSKSTQQQSRNTMIETKLSLLNKFHQKNIQEDLKGSVLHTRGTANDVQNFANSGSSREFLGLISKDYQENDEKQIFKLLQNDQCENLETTLECNAQKANNFIVQDENEISKKNYISSFLIGGETVEERYSATLSQNQKTFSKSLVSVTPQPDNNQVEGSNDNLEKTASDSDEEKQKESNDQLLNLEINRLQSELLLAYQKEKVFLEDFQKMNRKQNQLQQYNQMLLQKNQKHIIEIANLNFKLEQIMNILGNKQNGEQYYQAYAHQNENQLNSSLTKRQLSNTKKLSFSQLDCQDIYQTQEFLTQNFEEDNSKYQNLNEQNDENKQENQDDIQQNSQMQTIEEEDILKEDSRGNGILSSKFENQSQNHKSSYVQLYEINQNSQIPSASNSNFKEVQLGSNNEGSPILIQQLQHLNKWEQIKQKSQEFKMQEKIKNFRIINNSNKSFKCVPVVQLKLEDFSNSQKQLQMSAPIGKKQFFMQSHKKALFSGQQASQSFNERKSQSSNDFNNLRSQHQTLYFKNGNVSSRSQDAPQMNKMIQKGMKKYIFEKNIEDNTCSIADEKEGENLSYYQNINNNKYNTQNLHNRNILSLPNIITSLPQQELELLCRLLDINSKNILDINIDEICRNLTEYMERIQYKDELENLKSKLPMLMKHMHMLRQQEIIKQHKLHQLDSSKRYQSNQPSLNYAKYPDYDNQKYLLKFQQNLKNNKNNRSQRINKLPLSNQNYYSQRHYTAYEDNQLPYYQQQKNSDTSKHSQIAIELESEKTNLNQNSNSQIKNVSTRFAHLQEDYNFKQLNFSFQEKQANRLNELQMEEILQENIFDNEFIQNEQKSVFESLEKQDSFENKTFQNFNNQNLRKKMQVRNFNEKQQKLMTEIVECTFEDNTGTNLTNIHESKDQKQIINKNKIVNHFYNNVQMMDIVPQTCRNTNYYSQNNQYDSNILHPAKKNATPVFNGNQRWHSNSLRRRSSQLLFHSEKQSQYEKHNQVCNKSSLLRKQYNSVGNSLQLKNNRDHYSQRAKGSVLCLLTGKYQQRASELNNQTKEKQLYSTSQLLQMFPKNLHDRLNINGANSFQYQNRSAMSLKDSVIKSNEINTSRSLV